MSESKKPTETSDVVSSPKAKRRIEIAEASDPYSYLEKRVNPLEVDAVKYRFGVELFDKILEQRKFQRISQMPREETRNAKSYADFYFDASKGFFSTDPLKAGCIVTDVPSEMFRGIDGEQLFLQLLQHAMPKTLHYIDEGDFDDLLTKYVQEKTVYDKKRHKFKKLIDVAQRENNAEKQEKYRKDLSFLESSPPKRPMRESIKWVTVIDDELLKILPQSFRLYYKQRVPKKDRITNYYAEKAPIKATERIQKGTTREEYIDAVRIDLNTCYFVPFAHKLPKTME